MSKKTKAKVRFKIKLKNLNLLLVLAYFYFGKFVLELKDNIMFGDMMGMMNKIKETQQKVEETKKRMDTVIIEEQSSDALLKVSITANRELKNISVADELMKDKEQLEDYLVLTLNKAISRATSINEAELAAVAKEGMPDIPGLNDMLGQ